MTEQPEVRVDDLAKAIEHAVNYHSLDARLNMSDFAIGELLAPEVAKWLRGETDVQVFERMSPEDRKTIFGQPEDEGAAG